MADPIIDTLPRTRKEALSQGLRHFFTGRACCRGHVSKRSVHSGCLECHREDQAKKYLADSDGFKEKWRKWRSLNIEGQLARSRAWREANLDKARALCRAWKKANPDKARKSPEQARLDAHRRRARKHKVSGSHGPSDIKRIRYVQKDRCAYCMTKLKGGGELDHIEPISRGGSNAPRNLQMLCQPCNRAKNARDPIEFVQSRGLLI